MSFLASLLIVALLGTPPECTYEEPPAPNASRTVQAMLKGQHPTRTAAERARHYAVMKGDAVGEAQGNFILARIAFETSGTWPSVYLERAADACAKGGCGPEMMEGLFGWANVVGPRSPVFQQAIDLAFSVAEHETLRPLAAVDQLFEATTALKDQKTPNASAAAARSQNLAIKILRQESDARSGNNPARRASAANRLGDILDFTVDPDGAARAYRESASVWSGAGCRPEGIRALMKWASAIHYAKRGRQQLNDVLAQALSEAESANNRPSDTDEALSGDVEIWKDGSAANQKHYLQLRRTLTRKAGGFEAQIQLQYLARDAEALNDSDLAYELYSELLKSARADDDRKEYLEDLARVADKLGKQTEASAYRRRAAKIPESSAAAADAAAGGAAAASSDDSRRSSPWKPPERPGKEGGTPGERRRDPQR